MERLLIFIQQQKRAIGSIVGLILLVAACATPSAPEGGPQDRQAPRLHPKRYSTPNPSTNFQYKRVILTFDEWVRLQAASTQVIISPPLKTKPSIKVRNKSVVVEWKEDLKDSTTYIINFGESIQDITEGNKVSDMKMVFSKGPYLDSLVCSGQVIDAATRQPSADTWVLLYNNLADSVPKTEQPFYFTKTDEMGKFKIEYIKKGRYQIFSLKDQNNDYKYNLPKESIGFLDSSFVINDTTQPLLRLLLFQERQKLAVKDVDLLQYGELSIALNEAVQSPSQIQLLDAPRDLKMLVEQGEDSVHIWFDGTISDTATLQFVLFNESEVWRDTLVVSNKKKNRLLEDSTAFRWFLPNSKKGSSTTDSRKPNRGNKSQKAPSSLRPAIDTVAIAQHPVQPLRIAFTAPIAALDSQQFILAFDTTVLVKEWKYEYTIDTFSKDTMSVDSVQVSVQKDTFLQIPLPLIQRDSNAANILYILIDSTPEKRYQLTLLPNGVTDFWGRSNQDTLSRIYQINPIDKYGSITSVIIGADSSKQYIVELVNQQQKIVSRRLIQDSSTITRVDYHLPIGSYTIRVSTDLNRNQRWDVGQYDQRKQPEPRYVSRVIQLQAGWENTMELDLKKKPLSNKREQAKRLGSMPSSSKKKQEKNKNMKKRG